MTERLFDTNSSRRSFSCRILSLERKDGKLIIETDRTAFFPEGGGQTSDRGFLAGVYINDVQELDGRIFHYAKDSDENYQKLSAAGRINGEIDWEKRFSDMQQHSGEHIFSGIVHTLYGFDNIGFHLGTEIVTLDFDGILGAEEIYRVEELVNKVVSDNIESVIHFPTKQELASMIYRSKKEIEGQVRLVEFPGVDMCACCAPQVKRTGDIGVVEVVDFEKYKGGTRVSILCGDRAIKDIRHKLNENHKVSVLTCAKQRETAQAVERLKKENESLDYEITGLKREIIELKIKGVEAGRRAVIFDKNLEGKMLQDFALSIMERCEEFACCFCGENESYRYCLVSDKIDLAPIGKALNEAFSGRGGGRGGIIQGTLKGNEKEIREFLLRL